MTDAERRHRESASNFYVGVIVALLLVGIGFLVMKAQESLPPRPIATAEASK